MLYAITNRRLYGSDEDSQRRRLLDLTALWAADRVTLIQLREKDLHAHEQVELARAMLEILQATEKGTGQRCTPRLLINGRVDVALAAGADGVHLPSGPEALTLEEVRAIFAANKGSSVGKKPFLSVACHTLAEIEQARQHRADCVLFAPVFEKRISRVTGGILPGTGLKLLAEACRTAAPIPVFALGGVTAHNALQCIGAGVAGIAAIRLMLEPPTAWRNLA